MCSIFGFVARKAAPVRLDILRDIVRANIMRGPHAFGFAWIDGRGVLRCYRQRGRLVDQLDMLTIARDARMLIGHLRYATHGSPSQNINNHPHPCDGGWLVHNGVVTNYDDLLEEYGMPTVSECDSEAIGLLIEGQPGQTRGRRLRSAVKLTRGPLAVMGLWSRPNLMTIARRGNPLHLGDTGAGVYFGSLAAGLPGTVRSIPDDRVVTIRQRAGALKMRTLALPASGSAYRTVFDANTYRGG